ncbi:MAG: tetratricopeptide repeat protein, partial [Pirellulaceae bacterium]|nr:tetratricopeptide repeat protein [Pirellulaceae bacterium]
AVPREAVPAKHRAAFDTALEEYIKSQSVVSDQPASYTAIADIHKNQGRPDEAEKEYQKALQLDPNFVPARSHLALIHYERGDKQKAEDEYRRILESESHRISQFAPSLPGIHYSLGLLLAEDESRWDEAVEFLAKAVDATPSNPRIRRNLGWLYYQMGKPELAEPQLVEAHRLAPTWAEALHTLGFFYWRQGELPKALQCAERLVQLLPDDEGAKQFLMQIRAQIDGQPSLSPP